MRLDKQPDTLLQCLAQSLPPYTDGGLPTILDPARDEWAFASKPYNLRLASEVGPLAIVYPSNPAHIASAISCAHLAHTPIAARSGGHSYAAYSLGGSLSSAHSASRGSSDKPNPAEPSLIVDMRGFRSMEYDEDTQQLTVGSGALLGEVIEYLERRGRLLPTGSCPTVGVGGQVLAGGFGLASRMAGLLLDNLVAMDVVLADGTRATISEDHMPDLYWGMRGAGPSLALAHTFYLRTHPLPRSVIYYELSLLPRSLPPTRESATRAARFYDDFEAFGESESAVPELGMFAWHVTPEPMGNADGEWGTKVEVLGQFMGDEEGFEKFMGEFQGMLRARGETEFQLGKRTMSFIDSAHNVGGNWTRLKDRGATNINEHVNFYAKSLLTKTPLPSFRMTRHLAHLLNLSQQSNPSTGVEWFVLSPFLGGPRSALTHIPRESTAFAHRDVRVVWEVYAKYLEEVEGHQKGKDDLVKVVEGMAADLLPVEAVYPAYVDPELSASQYPKLIWGDFYPRLQSIKKRYDPSDVFRYPQSVKLPRSGFGGGTFLLALVVVGVLAWYALRGRRSKRRHGRME
ncbi:hypothetical protein IAT38_005947 [Cryptococcus sp. DSM 104549]